MTTDITTDNTESIIIEDILIIGSGIGSSMTTLVTDKMPAFTPCTKDDVDYMWEDAWLNNTTAPLDADAPDVIIQSAFEVCSAMQEEILTIAQTKSIFMGSMKEAGVPIYQATAIMNSFVLHGYLHPNILDDEPEEEGISIDVLSLELEESEMTLDAMSMAYDILIDCKAASLSRMATIQSLIDELADEDR